LCEYRCHGLKESDDSEQQVNSHQSLIKTFDYFHGKMPIEIEICNHAAKLAFPFDHLSLLLPPGNDLLQSTQLTAWHLRHRLAWTSTAFFLSMSPQPSQEKKTMTLVSSTKTMKGGNRYGYDGTNIIDHCEL
jgi:hypothetical protein